MIGMDPLLPVGLQPRGVPSIPIRGKPQCSGARTVCRVWCARVGGVADSGGCVGRYGFRGESAVGERRRGCSVLQRLRLPRSRRLGEA